MKSILEPTSKEDITQHIIFLQQQHYKIRKEIEKYQEKLNNLDK